MDRIAIQHTDVVAHASINPRLLSLVQLTSRKYDYTIVFGHVMGHQLHPAPFGKSQIRLREQNLFYRGQTTCRLISHNQLGFRARTRAKVTRRCSPPDISRGSACRRSLSPSEPNNVSAELIIYWRFSTQDLIGFRNVL